MMGQEDAQELELALDAEIAEIAAGPLGPVQAGEVARSFLCRARGLAREGKVELAKRQQLAARNVLAGGGSGDGNGVEGVDGAR